MGETRPREFGSLVRRRSEAGELLLVVSQESQGVAGFGGGWHTSLRHLECQSDPCRLITRSAEQATGEDFGLLLDEG